MHADLKTSSSRRRSEVPSADVATIRSKMPSSRTVEARPNRRQSANADMPSYGSRKKPALPPKRRRGETAIDANSGDPRATRSKDTFPDQPIDLDGDGSVASRRNGSYHHSPNLSSRGQTMPQNLDATHLDLTNVAGPLSKTKIDVMLDSSRNPRGATNPTPSPTSAPATSTRGSGRVRTPSVLLSSHPGEKTSALRAHPVIKNKKVSYCLRLVKDMLRLKDGFGFSKPIDQLWSVDQLPGYFEMISNPMDLDTVRQRLEEGYYLSSPGKEEVEEVMFNSESFASDMRLIFSNAKTYNRSGDIFYDAATRLSEKFETKFAQMPAAIASASVKKSKKRRKSQASANDDDEKRTDSAKRRKVGGAGGDANTNGQQKRNQASKKKSATQSASKAQNAGGTANRKKIAKPVQVVERNTETMSIEDMKTRLLALQRQKTVTEAGSPASSPATGGDSYLAEAKALYHIPMTFDEKVQLSQNVSKLPADKLQKLVKLAAKNNSSSMEVNNREEIELDIESMNNKTLREMEAFVNQTLFRKKGGGPNADVFSMSNTQVVSEIAKLTAILRKRSKAQNGSESSGDATGKKQRSFYDSDSSSDSDESGSGNSSDGESSSGSESSDEESDAEMMRKTRERNLAHQQAMQAAGTPLPSPPYQNSGRT